jgi:hypothetical protein
MKKEHYVVEEVASDRFDVVKLVKDEASDWVEASRHATRKDACDCKGFQFRKVCRHVRYVREEGLETAPVKLPEARRIAARVMEILRPDFVRVDLEDEPYDRDENGLIKMIRMTAVSRHQKHPLRFFVTAEGLCVRIRVTP